jgi:hypothetical protein
MRLVNRRIEQRPLDSGLGMGRPVGSAVVKIFPTLPPITKAALCGVSHFRATRR